MPRYSRTSSSKRKTSNVKQYLEKTKYYPVSPATSYAVMYLNNYKRRALDLGCGALRDSKYFFNCGFTVDAIDKQPQVKKYTEFFKYRPKGLFNIIVADYNKYNFGKNKYILINAQNTLSFNREVDVSKIIEKIYNALKKGGYFSGNLFGPKDTWVKERDEKMSFYTLKKVKKLISKFKIRKIWEYDEDGETANGEKKHWHIINFVAQKSSKNNQIRTNNALIG
ncbi:MAG: hypothetical protein US60_C0002G0043 [Microgenomates group bacterium GW2011_GWC1_37_8]|uniref:Tellurite resistance methyltransferase TehB-like domain-containing protein n=2 Tax=Candidatus Woeseibacteriota TaxID=1752722 RepID=A0A0G0P824_9BACT|nr:MAG: hypothetical protein US60_C0002G0043 [Microgenomates group bacterium GW2011_GWC1_37_8]KKQ85481.1 MAG: hypothetical protein UT08_C0006G0064 [Candidatus Woesebacteria bacterium GW2011_GWB1_38_8]OGM20393.1 MAG: hypothetical protein A2863_00765 [Candidatus Woesebacteria bacterium RIFCSPHIGHO2_01_FULL_38_9b]